MADKVIAKTDLRKWLAGMAADHDVIAPIGREAGPATWKDINGTQDIDITANQMVMAAKEFLLPVHDVLFRFHTRKGEERLEVPDLTNKSTVMIGLRLCDVRAISVLDAVYYNQGPFRDAYYAARRDKLALVAAVCDDPRWSCFCTTVGDLKEWKLGADVLITDLGDKIYVQPVTEKGEGLLQGDFFSSPSEDDVRKKSEVWANLLALPKRPFAGKDISKIVSWDDPVWEEQARKCIGCGICTFMCPTCSCFDIQDETTGSVIERYRCRDTCQFSDFTMMGAGHNPRPEKKMRVRQRVLHKFKYQVEQFDLIGCTGCGRCVESCPVNIDIRGIVSHIAAEPL
ncbi:MAG: 4Fe-4S dicluster domain-containing protein [Armatimonadetes bacterium]|nr:4Fe-4S dicluster domain-containing protein [Armatimonadota bacterium]